MGNGSLRRRFRDFQALPYRYDAWFDEHPTTYVSELMALVLAMRGASGLGLEVGVGTGRFAAPLGIQVGLDPAASCLMLAKRRGVMCVAGVGEELPFRANAFDLVAILFTFCFLEDPGKALEEARRVLKPGGVVLVAIIDRESPLGQRYMEKKARGHLFYRDARFFTPSEVEGMLRDRGFTDIAFYQTIFGLPEDIEGPQVAMPGCGQGAFVVVRARKGSP